MVAWASAVSPLESGRRHGETDAGFLGQIAGDGGGVAGVLLVAEREHADALRLRHAAEIRDRDAGHAVDGGEVVELERIDDEMKAIRQILIGVDIGVNALYHCGHSASP